MGSSSSSSSSRMNVCKFAAAFLLLFSAQQQRAHASCLLSPPSPAAAATAAAATAAGGGWGSAAASGRPEKLLFRGDSQSLFPLEGAAPPRYLLGHLFSSSLRSLPWQTFQQTNESQPEADAEEQQPAADKIQQLQQQLSSQSQYPRAAKALSGGALGLFRSARQSAAAAAAATAAAARRAAAAAVPKDELGQRLLSGALTRVYMQALMYPIDTLRARAARGLPLQGLSLSALYEGALPALLLGDAPYSLICGLLHAKASAALKKYASGLPPLAASALAALLADSAGVMYKTPHEAMKVLRQKGLASNTSQAVQKTAAAAPTLQRAMPVTIVRDAFFRVINGYVAGRIRGYFLSRRQRMLNSGDSSPGCAEDAPVSVLGVDPPESREKDSTFLGLKGVCRWLESRRSLWKTRESIEAAIKTTKEAVQPKTAQAARLHPSSSEYAEAALVGGVAASIAGVAASPLDAARALVVREAAADSKDWKRFAGFTGVATALHAAASSGGLSSLFATAPLRVLLGGCCGALASAFNLRCMATLAALRAAADNEEAANACAAPAAAAAA